MGDIEIAQALKLPKKLKPVKAVHVERSQADWKKLIIEAKRKEMFWTIGIVPASPNLVHESDCDDSDDY